MPGEKYYKFQYLSTFFQVSENRYLYKSTMGSPYSDTTPEISIFESVKLNRPMIIDQKD